MRGFTLGQTAKHKIRSPFPAPFASMCINDYECKKFLFLILSAGLTVPTAARKNAQYVDRPGSKYGQKCPIETLAIGPRAARQGPNKQEKPFLLKKPKHRRRRDE